MSDQPNFLLFCVDQMQAACLGVAGHPDVRTPNIDRLAATGTHFTRGYCPQPVCMPSRSSIITGLTPRGHGVITNGQPLPEHIPTIGAALAAHGYRTHAVGKLHLQSFMSGAEGRTADSPFVSWEDRLLWDAGRITSLPENYYGFQTTDYVGGHVSYIFGDYGRWLDAEHPGMRDRFRSEHATALHSSDPPCWTIPVPAELHWNTWIANRSAVFIESARESPFLLWCSFPDPHFPFAAPREYSERYDPASLTMPDSWDDASDPTGHLAELRRTLDLMPEFDERVLRHCMAETYAMIEHIDDCVGTVLSALDEAGVADNTVVAFMADHGEYLGAHHLVYKGPWPYEELYNIPFIWRAPNAAPRTVSGLASLLDVTPTLLDYAGLTPVDMDTDGAYLGTPPALAGVSLRPVLNGSESLEGRAVTVERDAPPGKSHAGNRTLVESRYKLSVYAGTGGGTLFDLDEDPGERRNLWDDPAHAETKSRMMHRMVEQFARTDRFDVPRVSGA